METTTPSTRDQPIVHTKERPILFSGAMVRAILDGRKTQTRRIVRNQPPEDAEIIVEDFEPTKTDRCGEEYPGEPIFGAYSTDGEWGIKCPYGCPCDRLWVRETWSPVCEFDPEEMGVFYRADYRGDPDNVRWKPSIHMPRWASRITLEIKGIGIERLNEISRADAIHEGCQCAGFPASLTDVGAFAKLWEQINGDGSWKLNPWVWVVAFKIA